MSPISICLFGKLAVSRDGKLLTGFEAGKVQELFGYVLINRHCQHLREVLASLLWGEISTAQSKKYLRQTLWQLQAALESGPSATDASVLQITPEWLRVNPDGEFSLDIAVFEEAFALARDTPSQALSSEQIQRLEQAVDLYRGEFLEGCYQDWCLFERERMLNIYVSMLDKLMVACQMRHHYDAGIAYGDRILRYDRAREQTHRRLMILSYLSGDRTAALRQFQRCSAALVEELGVKPSARTLAVLEQIRADRLDARLPEVSPAAIGNAEPSVEMRDLLAGLRSAWLTVAAMEHELQQQIRAVERLVRLR
jgi:DNA-binding SARP family transcriptional activator